MTQYDAVVERQRQLLAMEAWSKQVKQIYGHDGIIEISYNNGDIFYEENKPKGKTWTVKGNLSEDELLSNFSKFKSDSSSRFRK